MRDVLLLLSMLLVCGGFGLPVAELLPPRFTWRLAIAPALGYGVLAVLVAIAYRWGVTIPVFFYASSGLALVIIALRARRLRARLALVPPEERRLAVMAVLVCAGAAVVLLLPRWIGGDQFAVFQGNQWDTFGYLESAIAYARKPYSFVLHATDYQVMKAPLLVLGQTSLTNRPSVHELYAVFSRIAPGQAYRLYYPFLVFSMLQVAQVGLFVLRNTLPERSPRAWLAVALVFPLGFWGQYVFDINAWSHVGAAPILFLVVGLVLDIAARSETDRREATRLAAVLAIALAGCAFLYPEATLLHMAALVPIAGVAVCYRMVRARRFLVPGFVQLLGFLGVCAVVLYGPLLTFIVEQVVHSAQTKVSWWEFFQAFFFGRDGRGGAATIDFAAGFFGLYFATPAAGASAAVAALEHTAIVITLGGLLAGLAFVVARAPAETRKRLVAWIIATVLLMLPAARLALAENYWPAGKIVSYASPLFMTLVSIAVAQHFPRRLVALRWVTGAFIAFQLATAAFRIAGATHADGIHYALPYPAVQDPALKRGATWDLAALEGVVTPATKVMLAPMDPWRMHYLALFLYARRVPFAIEGNVNTYYGAGRDLGALRPPWPPDITIAAEGRSYVVSFADGRAPLRVVSDGDLR